jgi:hypothetical protein
MLRMPLPFMFAMIPVVIFSITGFGKAKPSPPVTPVVVEPEFIRTQRRDENIFRRRWEPVFSLPPAVEVHYVREDAVSTVSGVGISPPALPIPAHRRALRTKHVRLDVCERHRMRKVFYGRTWRCRR